MAVASAMGFGGFAASADTALITVDADTSLITRYAYDNRNGGSPDNPTEVWTSIGASGDSQHEGSSVRDRYFFTTDDLRAETSLARGLEPTPQTTFSAAHTKAQITFTVNQAVTYAAAGSLTSFSGINFMQLSAALVDDTAFGIPVFEYTFAENQRPAGTTMELDPTLLTDLSGLLEAGHTYTWTYELNIRRDLVPGDDVFGTAGGYVALAIGDAGTIPSPDTALASIALLGLYQFRRRAA